MAMDMLAVTIGVGEPYAVLAREAAQRMRACTGLEVRILGERELAQAGVRHPDQLKFRLFDLVEAEHLLIFDADAFCLRPWQPRTFAGGPEWVAVRGFWFDPRVQQLGQMQGFEANISNGGLFICNRQHHARVLRLAEHLQPGSNTFLGVDSTDELALAMALRVLGIPIRFLDRRYNWIQFGRGGLEDSADVIVAHACRQDLRARYLAGSPAIREGTGPGDGGAIPEELAGKTFIYDRVGYDLRPLSFRADGTVGAGGEEAERYYFLARGEETRRPRGRELVIGSAWEQTCRLRRGPDGIWRGRWLAHEGMPVTLEKHRAQVLLDLLAERGDLARPLVGVEVGVWQGESSRLLLHGLSGLHLYLVDPWQAEHAGQGKPILQHTCDQAWAQAADVTAFAAARRTIVPGPQRQVASFVPDGLDLVFLDADHSPEQTREAIDTWWPKWAGGCGGLFAGHDYGNPNFLGVKQAVDDFARQHGLRVRTGPDLVWWYEVGP
jgi:hypothetical protein